MLHKLGIIGGLVILAVVLNVPQAQAQQCYNCVYNPDSHLYSCVEAQGGYGYGCFTTGGTTCTFRGVCGGTRPLADGSAISARTKSDDSRHAYTRLVKTNDYFVALHGNVERGCGGAILARHYDPGTRSKLRNGTRKVVL